MSHDHWNVLVILRSQKNGESMKKWMVYYINSAGQRDGNEYIYAQSREEALDHYRQYFNVSNYEDCRVIPVLERGVE
mgnify:CR=1 FL=1